MAGTRYSKTREANAQHTAATKLTLPDKQALHYMAVERGLSDYQLTRQILVGYIRKESQSTAKNIPNHPLDCSTENAEQHT